MFAPPPGHHAVYEVGVHFFLHGQVARKRAVWEAEVEEVKVRPGHIIMAHTQTQSTSYIA